MLRIEAICFKLNDWLDTVNNMLFSTLQNSWLSFVLFFLCRGCLHGSATLVVSLFCFCVIGFLLLHSSVVLLLAAFPRIFNFELLWIPAGLVTWKSPLSSLSSMVHLPPLWFCSLWPSLGSSIWIVVGLDCLRHFEKLTWLSLSSMMHLTHKLTFFFNYYLLLWILAAFITWESILDWVSRPWCISPIRWLLFWYLSW